MRDSFRRAATLFAAAGSTLALPAVAAAHPSVFSATASLAATSEQQSITIDATGGTFLPSAGASAVDFDATAAAVQSALEADAAIGVGGVAVTGSAGGPYSLVFRGLRAATNVAQVVPDATGLTGGASTAIAATVTEGGSAIVYPADPATMPTQTQYVIAEHGYAPAYKETNGVSTGGVLNLKAFPSAYRAPATGEQWLAFAPAQTGVQAHATCQGVAALADPANILLAQSNEAQPFWAYVPWQSTSAGMGDLPAEWMDVVAAVVHAHDPNAAVPATVPEFQQACTDLGGVYTPADAALTSITSAVVADAVAAATAPLNAQITDLTAQLAAANTAKVAAETARDAALAAKATLEAQVADLLDRPLTVSVAARVLDRSHLTLLVTGRAADSATITARIPAAVARSLGLPGPVIATTTRALGAQGARLVTLQPSPAVARRLDRRSAATPLAIKVVSGGRTVTASAVLSR